MKSMGRAMVAAGLACLLAVTPEAALAARKTGAKLKMSLTTKEVVEGELVGVRGETLVLLTERGDRTVGIREAASILVRDQSGRWIGTAIGLAAGVAADVALYHDYKTDLGQDEAGEVIGAILYPGMIAVLLLVPLATGFGGGLIGHAAHKGTSYDIQRMTDEELKGLLEKLRKKAMVPDYK